VADFIADHFFIYRIRDILDVTRSQLFSDFNHFMQKHCHTGKPLLAAVSGGPDSMALLHLLLKYRSRYPFALGVAHVDHGWREEASDEASAIEQLCKYHSLAFHLLRLDPNQAIGNLESYCRRARLEYFGRLCSEHSYESVMLGHHRDDLAETVLKRVLEGARIHKCTGMNRSAVINGITYLRPLLGTSKKEIVQWLEEKNIAYFIDRTNEDPKFLRARMRNSILPDLSRQFGKEVGSGLAAIGAEAAELDAFLQDHMRPFLEKMATGPFGNFLNLEVDCPHSLFEARHLIYAMLPSASREIATCAASDLLNGAANKRYVSGGKVLYVDRKTLFCPEEKNSELPDSRLPLEHGAVFGTWKVQIQETASPGLQGSWMQILEGQASALIPKTEKPLFLGRPEMAVPFGGQRSIGTWWSKSRVPTFLRGCVPVVWNGDEILTEFLSGKGVKGQPFEGPMRQVILTSNP
jgi:tRNA(Ile)-lysidine synthase